MKRISLISMIALVLAVVMCVTLVSCEEKNIAPEDVVKYVAKETYNRLYVDTCKYAEMLATGKPKKEIEDQMDEYFSSKYSGIGFIDVFAEPTENTVGVKMGPYQENLKEDLEITSISYSGTEETTSADFTLSYTGDFKGKQTTMKVEGKFTLGTSKKSIVLSSVVFDNVEYDPDNFNKELKDMLK